MHHELRHQADSFNIFVSEAERTLQILEGHMQEAQVCLGALKVQQRSMTVVLEASDRKHRSLADGFWTSGNQTTSTETDSTFPPLTRAESEKEWF